MKNFIKKYGISNVIMFAVFCVVFILNNILITKDALYPISENLVYAYMLNFFIGCEGLLGKLGGMSYELCIKGHEFWRAITSIYVHAGLCHTLINGLAMLIYGKYVIKRIGPALYVTIFHVVAVLDGVISCLIFTSSYYVGSSAGIFAIIGILMVMYKKKQVTFEKGELIYLAVFALSSVVGIDTLFTHAFSFVIGVICGLFLIKNNEKISATKE